MIFIYFYQSLTISLRFDLKSLSLSNIDEKRTTTLQRDSLNNLFNTNRESKSSLQRNMTKNVRIENKDIIKIQRYKKLI